MSRLQKKYNDVVVSKLKTSLGISNLLNVPKIEKVIINVGAGEAVSNPKVIDFITNDLQLIAGQKAVVTKAKKSIASFKLREGMPIGVMVTLRGLRMYEFLDRLISIAIPRMRDFKGISANAFDGSGNYNLAVRDQLIFPEIEFDKTDKVRGLGITIVTNTGSDENCKILMKELGFFFRD